MSLSINSYLNRVRPRRRLEEKANRNVDVIWLTRKPAPNFKIIAYFRRHNRKPTGEVCCSFMSFCRESDLFNRELVFIDGGNFKAANSKGRNFTDRKLKQALPEIDRKINAYLQELDQNDAQEFKMKSKPQRVRTKKHK